MKLVLTTDAGEVLDVLAIPDGDFKAAQRDALTALTVLEALRTEADGPWTTDDVRSALADLRNLREDKGE